MSNSTNTKAICIGGIWCDPSKMDISVQTVSGADAGRDQSGTMHVCYTTTKFKIALEWLCPSPEKVEPILHQIERYTQNKRTTGLPANRQNKSAIPVVFRNPITNTEDTRYFYVGDRNAPYQMWGANRKFFSRLAFDLIEI